MAEHTQGDITILLAKANGGDQYAMAQLFGLVEGELRAIAQRQMRAERAGHSLQKTVLIDDAFLRLVGPDADIDWQDRRHFYRTAARVMRRILIDHERARRAQRRGGLQQRNPATLEEIGVEAPLFDLLAVDEALTKLANTSPRQGEIVELHHFGGYTLDETARILGLSKTTVKADWKVAKARLFRELSESERGESS